MSHFYTLHLFQRANDPAPKSRRLVECDTDAEAIGEACALLKRERIHDAVEVWLDTALICRLGGREDAQAGTRHSAGWLGRWERRRA